MSRPIAQLHVHSEYSALDGLAKTTDYAARAARLGIPALALTDHGIMAGLPAHYRACKEAGIAPILGQEAYYTTKIEKGSKRPKYNHLTVLAKGEAGYRTLSKFSTASFANFYYTSVATPDTLLDLDDELENLVILSGCLGGPLAQIAAVSYGDELLDEMRWWQKNIPNFFVEIQDHRIDIDYKVTTRLVKAAKKLKIPWVVSGDSHFCNRDDAPYHEVLIAIGTGKEAGEDKSLEFKGEGYWLMSEKEMRRQFSHYDDEVYERGRRNTLKIAEMCETTIPEWENRSWVMPKLEGVDDPYGVVKKLAWKSLRRKGFADEERYTERLKHELRVFKKTDVSAFILIARDAVRHAKKIGIRVGTGRGSVGGSLICYLLEIHGVDPIRYNLRFDRFLNPERPRMPDIDIDFQASRRDEMFEYAREKYGEENVVAVATFLTMKNRSVFKAIAKSHGIEYAESNQIVRDHFPETTQSGEEESIDEEDYIPAEIVEKYPSLVPEMQKLRGVKRGFGNHAAGVIIANKDYDIHGKIPKMWMSSSKKWVAQYDLEICESMGLMKQDFLAVRNLDTIDDCVLLTKALVELTTGEIIEPGLWVPDEMEWDEGVWEMIRSGRVAGIFQLEGPSNANGCREIQPRCFNDIATILALYRKGPMMAGMVDRYLENRKNPAGTTYLHPDLKPILEETHGTLIYQEQILSIAEAIAGFDMGRADDLLRAAAKKKDELMKSIQPDFVKGCRSHSGMSRDDAETLWGEIKTNSEYLFNQCLTGDTVIHKANPAAGRGKGTEATVRLDELYRRYTSKTPLGQKLRATKKGLHIWTFRNGRITAGRMKKIVQNGVRPVWRITLKNGMSLKATANHRHLSTKGWRRTDELVVGEYLVVAGEPIPQHAWKPTSYAPGTPTGWTGTTQERAVARDGRLRPVLHGHNSALMAVKDQLPDHCEFCGVTDVRLEAAHLDHDRTNNTRENVKSLCNPCHKKHDGSRRKGKTNMSRGRYAKKSRIVSIEYVGEEMTYDIEMDGETFNDHNFVANGIVTHNSHAVGYGLMTYQTAALKYLYPNEYFCALLRTVKDTNKKKPKRPTYLREAAQMGIRFFPPDVNRADIKAIPDRGGIRFGLSDIKGIGDRVASKLVKHRGPKGYWSIDQIADVVNNSRTYTALRRANALACLGEKGTARSAEQVLGWSFADRMVEYRERYGHLYDPPNRIVGEIVSTDTGKTKTGKPFKTWVVKWSPGTEWNVKIWDSAKQHFSVPAGSIVRVVGKFSEQYNSISIGNPGDISIIASKQRSKGA